MMLHVIDWVLVHCRKFLSKTDKSHNMAATIVGLWLSQARHPRPSEARRAHISPVRV